MESLRENRPLLFSILGSSGVVLAITLGIVPELSAQFEIIDFPSDVSTKKAFLIHNRFGNKSNYFLFQFRMILVYVLFADFFFSFLVDRICLWLCGEGRLHAKFKNRKIKKD